MRLGILLLVLCAGLLVACKKENNAPPQPQVLAFTSLTSDDLEIIFSINPSTKIRATATGDGLKYYWSASAGDIIGSGATVTYTTNPACCGGFQYITCKVKDQYGKIDVKQLRINIRL